MLSKLFRRDSGFIAAKISLYPGWHETSVVDDEDTVIILRIR